MQPTQQQLDTQAKALAMAIRDTESKGDYNAKGGSGEWGAYQFTPDTWKAYSTEAGVNAMWGSATPEQQNEVAYKKIKQWKDQGYNPGQIASMWNAGGGEPDAYRGTFKDGRPSKGRNKFGVDYDVPTYAERVANAYQVNKSKDALLNRGQEMSVIPAGEGSLMEKSGGSLAEAGTKLAGAIGDTASGQINPLSGLIRGVGAVAGGITGVTNDVITSIPVVGDIVGGAEKAIGAGAQAFMDTPTGQSMAAGYGKFAEAHPELSGNIGAAVDIAAAVPVLKGLGMVKNKAKSAVSDVLHGKTDPVLDMVQKDLGPKGLANALSQRGTETKGLLRDVTLKPSPYDVKVADAVRGIINPKDGFLKNITEVQKVERALNTRIKKEFAEAAGDRIYSYKELTSALKSVEKPLMLKSDVALNNAYNRVIAKAMELAKKKKGRVDNLLSVRQELDRYIKKEFPNLYSSERLMPMTQAVKDIRNAITQFTIKQLPEGTTLADDLLQQHYLITATEQMSKKATKGATKELGLNAIGRYTKNNPKKSGLVKTAAGYAMQGAGLGGVMRLTD